MGNSYVFDFTGKTVIVTGAERGIGLELARGFAACGANIVVAGMLEDEFANAKSLIEQEGVRCLCVKTDVSNEESVNIQTLKFFLPELKSLGK